MRKIQLTADIKRSRTHEARTYEEGERFKRFPGSCWGIRRARSYVASFYTNRIFDAIGVGLLVLIDVIGYARAM